MLFYSSGFRIGLATSADGIRWRKFDNPGTGRPFAQSDPVLGPPVAGWDSQIAWAGTVLRNGTGFEMFYYGTETFEADTPVAIGYAYSPDGYRWQRFGERPVLEVSRLQAFFPTAVRVDDEYVVVYASTVPGESYTEFHSAIGMIGRGQE